MSYRCNYSMKYFGLYLWFAFVISLLMGIPWGIITSITGWDAPSDAIFDDLSVNSAVASGILFVITLAVFSMACKWSLKKTMLNDYKSFKISSPQEKIKFSTALIFQTQVVICSFSVQYIPVILGLEISKLLRVLLGLLVLFVSNYIIVIRWISQHATITPKDCCSSS